MHELTSTLRSQLVKKALDARSHSYSPYSKFRVGCALLTGNGKIFTGCNVENCSYGGAICAERVAYCKAISEATEDAGRQFVAVAISSDKWDDAILPCGICRQFMVEFDLDTRVLCLQMKEDFREFSVDDPNQVADIEEYSLRDLMLKPFTPKQLPV